MKVFYKKQNTTIITYRSYKHFSNEVFMADAQNRISQVTSENNELEFGIFKTALNEAIQRCSIKTVICSFKRSYFHK